MNSECFILFSKIKPWKSVFIYKSHKNWKFFCCKNPGAKLAEVKCFSFRWESIKKLSLHNIINSSKFSVFWENPQKKWKKYCNILKVSGPLMNICIKLSKFVSLNDSLSRKQINHITEKPCSVFVNLINIAMFVSCLKEPSATMYLWISTAVAFFWTTKLSGSVRVPSSTNCLNYFFQQYIFFSFWDNQTVI